MKCKRYCKKLRFNVATLHFLPDLQYEAKAGEDVCLVVREDVPDLSGVQVHLQSANLAETAPVEVKEGANCQPKGTFSTKQGERGELLNE